VVDLAIGTGEYERMRDVVGRVLPFWTEDMPLYHAILAWLVLTLLPSIAQYFFLVMALLLRSVGRGRKLSRWPGKLSVLTREHHLPLMLWVINRPTVNQYCY